MRIRVKKEMKFTVRRVLLIVVIISIVALIIFIPRTGNFIPNNTKSRYRKSENNVGLREIYNKDGMKESFLTEASKIQESVSMQLLNSDVVDAKSLKKKIKELNKELSKSEWEILELEVPVFWVGDWKIDAEGSVKFTFIHKDAEPSWVRDEDVSLYVLLNK